MDKPYHSAECERTEVCVDCGTAIIADKCRCGFWITRCHKCSAARSKKATEELVAKKIVEMRADFNARMAAKYGA